MERIKNQEKGGIENGENIYFFKGIENGENKKSRKRRHRKCERIYFLKKRGIENDGE